MKRNKTSLFVGLGAAVALAAVRLLQLLSINDQGVVSPFLLTVILYALVGGMVVYALVAVRRRTFSGREEDASGRMTKDLLLFFGVSLLCEAWFLYMGETMDRVLLLTCISAGVAGLLLAVTYVLRTIRQSSAAKVTSLVGALLLMVYLVSSTIQLFTGNRTTLSSTVNSLTLIMLCVELFYFKALLREALGYATDASRTSLFRSSLLLLFVIPSEILGQIVLHLDRFADLATVPARGLLAELVTDGFVLLLSVATLVSLLSTQPTNAPLPVDALEETTTLEE